MSNLFEGLICVSISFKVYTAREVGPEAAARGCFSYMLGFEHDIEKTKQEGLIGMMIEIASDNILEYDKTFPMWDGKDLSYHVGRARSEALL